ncbi:MAG: hypothetical protein MJZ75_02645 [Paludibacteraceae bacterium]|nr:hypothetical protein [Paludibacteraceae bacterium]
MKKIFLLVLVAVLAGTMTFVSCKKDKDEEEVQLSLVGTEWEGSFKKSIITVSITATFQDSEHVRLEAVGYVRGIATGIYTQKGNQVTITLTDVDNTLLAMDVPVDTPIVCELDDAWKEISVPEYDLTFSRK